jgi:hypothetical protein
MISQANGGHPSLHRFRTLKATARRPVAYLAAAMRRSAVRYPRRFGLFVGLACAGVVVRGDAGVLLGIFALMLFLDLVIPMTGSTWSEADERFWRLVRERRHTHRMRRLRRLPPERLDVLDEGDRWVMTSQRRALGVQPIRIDSVTGTVEESKAKVFDRGFRPDGSEHLRWKGVWMAFARGDAVPPVAVYRVGEDHIVRDGHHRISVARDHGLDAIDADVMELRRTRAD